MAKIFRFVPILLAGSLCAAEPSALSALKLIPKERASNLARIEARDGTPIPERWYVIVHDPDEANGVREFVVANNEIVASRPVSQFAEKLGPADVIAPGAVKVDSSQLARLARLYAQANNAALGRISYELKKEGAEAAPTWRVVCSDETGNLVGELVVTAGKGAVVSHEGFAVVPREGREKKSPKFNSYAESQVPRTGQQPVDEASDEQNSDVERSERASARGQSFASKFKHFFTGH